MGNMATLSVAAFQFVGSHDISKNVSAIERGVKWARASHARLLVTQECALCGYPPLEVESIHQIDLDEQEDALAHLRGLAVQYNLYIAVGHITSTQRQFFNTVTMLTPDTQSFAPYYKRALWGWDADNFTPGSNRAGVYTIDGMKVGVRICYEIRFPEYFRELFLQKVDLVAVPFADVGAPEQVGKREVMWSHLVTRAAENAMYVVTANSLSQTQLVPTCLIDQDGQVITSAPSNEEALIAGAIVRDTPNFGRTGRILHSQELLASPSQPMTIVEEEQRSRPVPAGEIVARARY